MNLNESMEAYVENLINPENTAVLMEKGLSIGTNVLIAILILIVGMWVSGKVQKAIIGLSKKSPHLDQTLFTFLATLARWMIMAVVFIAVLNRFGIQTTSIIALLGGGVVAVGLALQGTLSNFAAGVMLMIFRPYKVGDFVDVAGNFGNVEEVNVFTTNLQTFDNQQIVIPNSKIWGEKIINHSHHPVRGVEMRFNVAYESDSDAARKVIMDVLNKHPHVKSDPAPFVEVETLGDRSVEYVVRPFTDGAHYFDVRYTLPELIKKALGAAGMDVPYPTTKIVMTKD